MNSKELELRNAIEKTERMSGFDDMFNAEGDMEYFNDMEDFDGEDFDGIDGDGDGDEMSFASGKIKAKSNVKADPYVLQYTNYSATTARTAYIFGYNDFFGTANFGNYQAAGTWSNTTDVGVVNLQGGTYSRLIAQSNNSPFTISRWRFQSTTTGQLSVTMTVNYYNGNGALSTYPINLSIQRDMYAMQSDIVEFDKAVYVDGNTYLSFNLLASAVVTISMYATTIIDAKSRLRGGVSVRNTSAPKLSGKNAGNVIIKTGQSVKGLRK